MLKPLTARENEIEAENVLKRSLLELAYHKQEEAIEELPVSVKNQQLVTVKEVAEFLKVDPRTVLKLIASKRLIAHRAGRDWRMTEQDVLDYLGIKK